MSRHEIEPKNADDVVAVGWDAYHLRGTYFAQVINAADEYDDPKVWLGLETPIRDLDELISLIAPYADVTDQIRTRLIHDRNPDALEGQFTEALDEARQRNRS